MRNSGFFRAALVSLVLVSGARGGVIYSNFGPSDSYDTGSAINAENNDSISFLSASDQSLSEVDFAVYLKRGGTDSVTVSVSQNASTDGVNHPADTALSFATFTNLTELTPVILEWTLNPGQQVLASGQTYWITVVGPPSSIGWNQNDQGAFGEARLVSGTWTSTSTTQGALRIIGTDATSPTPEPHSWLLALSAFGALALLRVRKSAAGKHESA